MEHSSLLHDELVDEEGDEVSAGQRVKLRLQESVH